MHDIIQLPRPLSITWLNTSHNRSGTSAALVRRSVANLFRDKTSMTGRSFSLKSVWRSGRESSVTTTLTQCGRTTHLPSRFSSKANARELFRCSRQSWLKRQLSLDTTILIFNYSNQTRQLRPQTRRRVNVCAQAPRCPHHTSPHYITPLHRHERSSLPRSPPTTAAGARSHCTTRR